VRGRLGRVVDHDLPEVALLLQRVRRQGPDLDEVLEVAEVVEPREALDRFGRKRVVVPARDLEQGLGPHRSFEMDVQLDLREPLYDGSGAVAGRTRRSTSTESQIEPS